MQKKIDAKKGHEFSPKRNRSGEAERPGDKDSKFRINKISLINNKADPRITESRQYWLPRLYKDK